MLSGLFSLSLAIVLFCCSPIDAILNVCDQHYPQIRSIREMASDFVLQADSKGGNLFRYSSVESNDEYVRRVFSYRRSYSEFSVLFQDYLGYSRPPGIPYLEAGLNQVSDQFYNLYTECIAHHGHLRSYFERGMIYFDKGLYEHCMEDIKPVVESGQWDKIENENRKHELLLIQGVANLELGSYEKAVDALSEVVSKDPKNKEAHFNRAVAYFELGQFDRALKDYLESEKAKEFAKFKSEFSEHVGLEFLKGLKTGSVQAATDFFPSICNTVHGLGTCLWKGLQNPVQMSSYLYACCYEFCKEGAAYIKTIDHEVLESYAVEFNDLLRNFDALSEPEKARIIGEGVGKYGIDFFLGNIAVKCFSPFKKVQDANRVCNLQALARHEHAKEKITSAAREYAQKRQEYINNLKVHWDKQNKHIPGKHNYIEGKSILKVPEHELEGLIRQHAGKGKRLTGSFNEAGYKEKVDFQRYIGDFSITNKDKSIVYFPTTHGIITYAKNGTVHVWPCEP